jgi:hypothetical protein
LMPEAEAVVSVMTHALHYGPPSSRASAPTKPSGARRSFGCTSTASAS